MPQRKEFDKALKHLESGNYHELRVQLLRNPELVDLRDDSNATLLVRLIDYPGQRPNAHKTARTLLVAGADVDVRRDGKNGTALSGALSTGEIEVARVLLEFGASLRAGLGFMPGTIIDFAEEICLNPNADKHFVSELALLITQHTGIEFPRRQKN